jgi:hypothetical protein
VQAKSSSYSYNLAPIHHSWRIRDILRKNINKITSYHNQICDMESYSECTYFNMNKYNDPFSTNISLVNLPEKHTNILYAKRISDYFNDIEIHFKKNLKNIDDILSSYDIDKRKELIRQLNPSELRSRFIIQEKIACHMMYFHLPKYMIMAQCFLLIVIFTCFAKRGLTFINHCEGGFYVELSCSVTSLFVIMMIIKFIITN